MAVGGIVSITDHGYSCIISGNIYYKLLTTRQTQGLAIQAEGMAADSSRMLHSGAGNCACVAATGCRIAS